MPRRPTYPDLNGGDADHVLHCWDEPSGQGFLLRQEVRGMQKSLWMAGGVIALLAAAGPVVLGFWLNAKLGKSESDAARRDDSAVLFRQAHAEVGKTQP